MLSGGRGHPKIDLAGRVSQQPQRQSSLAGTAAEPSAREAPTGHQRANTMLSPPHSGATLFSCDSPCGLLTPSSSG